MNKKSKIALKIFALVILLICFLVGGVYLSLSNISIVDTVLHPFPGAEPVVQLDKKTFKLGENIEYSIINRTNESIRPEIASPYIEKFKDNSWERVVKRICPCGSDCMVGPARAFSPREKRTYDWDQRDMTCTGKFQELESRQQVSPGKFRIVFAYSGGLIYSEFEILP